jgi:hypothetical protein
MTATCSSVIMVDFHETTQIYITDDRVCHLKLCSRNSTAAFTRLDLLTWSRRPVPNKPIMLRRQEEMVSYKKPPNTVFHSMKFGRSKFEFLNGHLGGSKTSKYDSIYLTKRIRQPSWCRQHTKKLGQTAWMWQPYQWSTLENIGNMFRGTNYYL